MTEFLPTSDLARVGVGYVRLNWGTWLVDCTRPGCTSALAVAPGLSWGDKGFRCWDCDWVTESLVWPVDPEAIEALVFQRPSVTNRNWEPGETLADLLIENVMHGITPEFPELGPGESQSFFKEIDGRVVGGSLLDALPSGRYRQSIDGI